jgi:chemotaxis response regulator CheB
MFRSVRYTNKTALKGLDVENSNERLLVVATSEGGPPIVHAILSQLVGGFPIPIIIYQVSESGPIDPVCNALRRTTQLAVRPAETDTALMPGTAYVVPCGLRAVIKRARGENMLCVSPGTDMDRGSEPFVQFLRSACRAYRRRLMLVVVGGIADFLEGIMPGLEVVRDGGGEIVFVREPGIASTPVVEGCAGPNLRVLSLSADELVARLYRSCGMTGRVQHPI